MYKQRSNVRLVFASGFSLVLFSLAPVAGVFAQGGDGTSSHDSSGSASGATQSGTDTSGSTTPQARPESSDNRLKQEQQATPLTPEKEAESKDHTKPDQSDSLHAQAKQLLAAARQNHKQHTAAERQKSCAAHQTEINNRISRVSSRAQNHLDDFNSLFTKVQAYQTKKQLAVSNYDTLVAAATAMQTAATTSVSALQSVSVTVDCTAADPATNVATVKTAADDARTKLQAYRASLKSLVEALLAAKTTATTNGSN